jgi:hypothetical protein
MHFPENRCPKSFFKCILVTIVMSASCVVISNAIREAIQAPDSLTHYIAIVCPLLIAPPIIFLYQSEKLRRTLTELNCIMAELEGTNAKLLEEALRDNMTGLLNRETFFSRIDGLAGRGRAPCSSLMPTTSRRSTIHMATTRAMRR